MLRAVSKLLRGALRHLDCGPRVLETHWEGALSGVSRLGGSRDDHDRGVFSDSDPSYARRHRR